MLLMGMIIGLRAEASDSGTFFLKATKNVPRIGRRSGDGDNTFFLKAPKNVPRIGRRGESNGNPWVSRINNVKKPILYSHKV
jgi:hypothetical protein